jgi:fructoselysine-6-P-deglycase FrlB-like protein
LLATKEKYFMKTLMTTSLTAMLLAGTALMAAQTGNAPAPAANSSSTTAPAKTKKHHHKSKTSSTPDAATKSAPASTTPAK